MKTDFNVNNEKNCPDEDFEKLLAVVQGDFDVLEQQYAQSIACMTVSGNVYHTVLDNACTKEKNSEKAFLKSLADKNDVVIKKMVCMWADKSLDVPSNDFRNLICALHPDNKNTEILLQGEKEYVKMKIIETVK